MSRTAPWGAATGSLSEVRTVTPLALRRWSLALLLSLLPMFTFIDHIELSIDIPGTGYYFGVERAAGDTGHGHTDGADTEEEGHHHATHCHISAASCSDAPVTSVSGFALLTEAASLLGAGLTATAVDAPAPPLLRGAAVVPDPPPPR